MAEEGTPKKKKKSWHWTEFGVGFLLGGLTGAGATLGTQMLMEAAEEETDGATITGGITRTAQH